MKGPIRTIAGSTFLACVPFIVALNAAGNWQREGGIRDPVGDFDSWSPTSMEIARAVGPRGAGGADDLRRELFARLFQMRFRDHDCGVGLHFLSGNRLKLMCVRAVPQSDMARIAYAAHEEAGRVFDADCPVALFETIAGGNVHIGDGFTDPATGAFHVSFGAPGRRP